MLNKKIEWILHSTIAHRGFHNISKGIPENSIAAFSNAIHNGYAIEFDVRISKDNIVYVIHDKNLKRLCNKDFKFELLNSDEISKLRLQQTEEKIPTLKELLKLVDGQVPLLIEIKPTTRYRAINKLLLSQLDGYNGVYAIQSYSPIIVNWFKHKAIDIPRGIIAESFGHPHQPIYLIWWIGSLKIWNKIVKPDFYNYNIKDLPNKKMNKFKESGKMVISFTARNEEQLDFVKKNYHNAVFEGFIPKSHN